MKYRSIACIILLATGAWPMALPAVESTELPAPAPASTPERQWHHIDYLGLGWQMSAGGEDWSGARNVKPFHNARKYGYNRSLHDYNPGFAIYLGHQVAEPFFIELGFESSNKVYESSSMLGTLLASNTVDSSVISMMVAPVYRFTRKYSGLSLGCRLGWSGFNATIESATPVAQLGRLTQTSNIFAYEPFVRLDLGLGRWCKFGIDFGYAGRNFYPINNIGSDGIYAGAPAVDKNPDGTDTAVDFSGLTDKIFVAVTF